ncbi:hypothetical protein C1H87_08580 [Flavivirga eckloniae]|uniref:Uncharacterized protein n=2 Tax=Flavivirga eckloniae TaxID=1803846 RepID=A0A2K9PNV3_9FLAO|nr:hypothetical protein C1H87_08580 [Flavivirga eckloniae]
MNKDVKDIVKLGKDSIAQLALKLIDREVAIENFAKIKVKTDGREVYVSFRNPIKYLPIESEFYFDLNVNLLEGIIVYNPVSNGLVDCKKKTIPFYKQTREAQASIEFVIKAINKNDEVGGISDISSFEDDMVIREHKSYYDVSVVSEFQESFYKIKKVSGKVYDVEHAHLVPPPIESENNSVLKEIN